MDEVPFVDVVEDGEEPVTRFGDRVRQARLEQSLTQAEVAELSGVKRSALSGVEAGVRDPRLAEAKALAGALGLDLMDEMPSRETSVHLSVHEAGGRVYSLMAQVEGVASGGEILGMVQQMMRMCQARYVESVGYQEVTALRERERSVRGL